MNKNKKLFVFRTSIRQIFSKEITARIDEVTNYSPRLRHCSCK